MMSPVSNRSQQTGQVSSPSRLGFVKARSRGGSTGKSAGASGGEGFFGAEGSSSGKRNSTAQCGQSTRRPASSSSAFNFWPHEGQKKRNSIIDFHRSLHRP